MARSTVEVEDQITADYIGTTFHAIFLNDTRSQFEFTANASTDVITATGHDYINTLAVTLSVSGGGTLPAPLVAGTTYYVRDVATNTFKLSLTSGGAAIDITDAGTGTFVVIDTPLSVSTRTVAEMARKEISTYGALTNRPAVTFSGAIAVVGTTVTTFQEVIINNIAGVSDLPLIDSICLVRGGSATRLNTSGKPSTYDILAAPIVVPAGGASTLRLNISS